MSYLPYCTRNAAGPLSEVKLNSLIPWPIPRQGLAAICHFKRNLNFPKSLGSLSFRPALVSRVDKASLTLSRYHIAHPRRGTRRTRNGRAGRKTAEFCQWPLGHGSIGKWRTSAVKRSSASRGTAARTGIRTVMN